MKKLSTAEVIASLSELVRLKYGSTDPEITKLYKQAFSIADEMGKEVPPRNSNQGLTVYADGQVVYARNLIVSMDVEGESAVVLEVDDISPVLGPNSGNVQDVSVKLRELPVTSMIHKPVGSLVVLEVRASNSKG